MKWRQLGCAAALLAACCGALPGADPTPAFVLKAVREKLSLPEGATPTVLRITESVGAQKWEVQFEDPNFKGNRRLVAFQDGKVVDERAGGIEDAGSAPLAPLTPAEMDCRIADLRDRVAKLTEMAEVRSNRLRLMLLRPIDDPAAHWDIEVVDSAGRVVGRVVFGAPQLRLIACSWGADARILGPTSKSLDRDIEALGKEAEKAFRELEEGLRRILKGDDEGPAPATPGKP